jgi:hypothetical protein
MFRPELFGSAGDLSRPSDQTVRITAIDAVKRFEPIEIGEMLPIDDDVL